MNIITFDQYFFFEICRGEDRLYAHTHPKLIKEKPDAFHIGYFRTSDGSYLQPEEDDDRWFSDAEIKRIQRILAEHKSELNLEQFSVYQILPAHYRQVPPESERYEDINKRLRLYEGYDPDFEVAWDKLTFEEPAYRLTRDFITRILKRAEEVTPAERDEWLQETLLDTWTYDTPRDSNYYGKTFEEFYQKSLKRMEAPTPLNCRLHRDYRFYEIDGLPKIYLVEEIREELIDSLHYIDLGPVIAPIGVPYFCEHACYIL
ncbi:MAG: hypothetical protein JXM70_01550 [Pirellulales bacterium]|nr:hypothetical protein [Pirellulales bacterium]